MISILIPVHNFNAVPLVEELLAQSRLVSVPVEIICIDDASSAGHQLVLQKLKDIPQVRFERLKQNIGRSAIRNLLIRRATYPYLLFLDCDGRCPDKQFLQRYINNIDKAEVICGGRIYGVRPEKSELMLHWSYGAVREVRTAGERMKSPGYNFMTNNFLIKAEVCHKIRFDESLVQYGHEDTLFGLALIRERVSILHIANPIIHTGLEPAVRFLTKTSSAIENLALLFREGKVGDQVKLIRIYLMLKQYRILFLVEGIVSLFNVMIRQNLRSARPSLKLFDLFRLRLFAQAMRRV